MNDDSNPSLSSTLSKTLRYLYETLCLALLAIGLIKIADQDGGWVNYFMLFILGGAVWIASTYGQARSIDAEY